MAGTVSQSGQLVGEIAAASQEQSQGIDEVNKAVSEMDKVVQLNAATAEESASASEEMNAQAEQMKGFVLDLVALVGKGKETNKELPDPSGRKNKDSGGLRASLATNFSSAKKLGNGKGNGKAMISYTGRKGEVPPNQIIPFDDDEVKEF